VDCANKAVESCKRVRVKCGELRMERVKIDRTCRESVVRALQTKINDTGSLLQGLSGRLNQTDREIAEEENTRHMIRNSIEDNREPLQLAKTRLRCRAQRPLHEKKRDIAEAALEAEVARVSIANSQLMTQQKQLERTDAELRHIRSELQADSTDKQTAYDIDIYCLRLEEGARIAARGSKQIPEGYSDADGMRGKSRGSGSRALYWDENQAKRGSQTARGSTFPPPRGNLASRGNLVTPFRPPKTARNLVTPFGPPKTARSSRPTTSRRWG